MYISIYIYIYIYIHTYVGRGGKGPANHVLNQLWATQLDLIPNNCR